MTRRWLSTSLAVLIAAMACGDPPPEDSRDGQGITRGTVGVLAEPLVTLGGLDAPSETTFSGVYSGYLSPDGFTIGDAGAFEVREFDETGALRLRFGRYGQGPAEFENVRWVTQKADSVVVLDARLGRVSVFSREGVYQRSFQLPLESYGEAQWVEPFGDAYLLALASGLDPRRLAGPARDSLDLVVFDVHKTMDGQAMPEAGMRLARVANRWWEPTSRGNAFGLKAVFDGPVALADVMRGRIWVTDNDDSVLSGIRGGSPVERVAIDVPEAARELIPNTQGVYTRLYEQLVVDQDGLIWLSQFQVTSGHRRWTVQKASGEIVGGVELPADLRVLDIGGGRMLARRMDEMGVERVELWRITIRP